MPTYTFKNKETGVVFDQIMKIAEHDEFLNAHPELEQMIISAPMQVDAHKVTATRMRPQLDFQQRLQDIKSHHLRSTIKTWGVNEI